MCAERGGREREGVLEREGRRRHYLFFALGVQSGKLGHDVMGFRFDLFIDISQLVLQKF